MTNEQLISQKSLLTLLSDYQKKHIQLKEHFDAFAIRLKDVLCAPDTPVKGVVIDLELVDDRFTIKFVGCSIVVLFEIKSKENNTVVGLIRFLSKLKFHTKDHVQFGELEFNSAGYTNLREPQYGDALELDVNGPYIMSHFLHKAIAHASSSAT
jgi:hypothetical protein